MSSLKLNNAKTIKKCHKTVFRLQTSIEAAFNLSQALATKILAPELLTGEEAFAL
jgi:hypothetical protein